MQLQRTAHPHPRRRRPRLASISTLLLAALAALPAAAQAQREADPPATGFSADVAHANVSARRSTAKASGPTEAEVGDIDSFGRALRWLGVTGMTVELSDCTAAPFDGY